MEIFCTSVFHTDGNSSSDHVKLAVSTGLGWSRIPYLNRSQSDATNPTTSYLLDFSNPQEESHAEKEEVIRSQIWKVGRENCRQCDAPQETWHVEIGTRRQRRHGEEP